MSFKRNDHHKIDGYFFKLTILVPKLKNRLLWDISHTRVEASNMAKYIKAEYKGSAHTTTEMTCVKKLFEEMDSHSMNLCVCNVINK